MEKQAKIETKVIEGNFPLSYQPDAYIISVHIRNMFASMGEEKVRHILKELFNINSSIHIGSDTPSQASNE